MSKTSTMLSVMVVVVAVSLTYVSATAPRSNDCVCTKYLCDDAEQTSNRVFTCAGENYLRCRDFDCYEGSCGTGYYYSQKSQACVPEPSNGGTRNRRRRGARAQGVEILKIARNANKL